MYPHVEEIKPIPTAQKNAAAGKVNNENWCGSCSVAGYWTDPRGREGAIVLSNAHVLTTRIGDIFQAQFVIRGQDRTFRGENLIAAYSDTEAVDWAFGFIPGLTADSGIVPVKLSKEPPKGKFFYTTGSPRCAWPLVNVDNVVLQPGAPTGVQFWFPNAIGGQSGSSVINDDSNIAELLLTWTYGGRGGPYGAGQRTSDIWKNAVNRQARGVMRPEGLVEVGFEIPGRDSCVPGYHDRPEGASVASDISARDLPVWAGDVPTDPVDPVDPVEPALTDAELAACLKMKDDGFSLIGIEDLMTSLKT